ncbi:MAG: GHMP kinase [Thermoprotei archaeon]
MDCVEVVVPLNVSGVWYPVVEPEIRTSGSIGISLTLEPPLTAEACKSEKPSIVYNNMEIDLPHLGRLRRLGNLRLVVDAVVGLGYGYGLSGAVSLAYALAAAELYGLPEEVALDAAHEAEVINGTGLGDVASEYFGGGLIYRESPGSPTVAKVRTFPVEGTVCSKPVEVVPTTRIIARKECALLLIHEFLRSPSLSKFFEVSKEFSREFGYEYFRDRTFRKKGLILSMDRCTDGWISHTIARYGAYVR